MPKQINLDFLESQCPPTVKDRSYDGLLTWLLHTEERTIAVCERLAYANVQKRFREISKMPGQDKQAYRDDVTALIARCLDELFMIGLTDREAFDAWHNDTCMMICEVSDRHNVPKWATWMESGFTYGLAQNWLNITIKNMLLMERWDSYLEPIRKYLHVSVDSFIIQAASDDFEIPVPCKNNGIGKYSVSESKQWSRWDHSDYITFQEALRNSVDRPMDWEFSAWNKN